jgi:hypothetical protein
MPSEARGDDGSMVELPGVVSLATGLGTGQPQFIHGVRNAVLTVALGRELD